MFPYIFILAGIALLILPFWNPNAKNWVPSQGDPQDIHGLTLQIRTLIVGAILLAVGCIALADQHDLLVFDAIAIIAASGVFILLFLGIAAVASRRFGERFATLMHRTSRDRKLLGWILTIASLLVIGTFTYLLLPHGWY